MSCAKKPPSSRLDEALKERHEALALVEEQFRDFDVVWAKVIGFPWWPGVLFHSWDVVRRAGIRTDAKIVETLLIPPPQRVPVVDAVSGEETGTFRVRRYCLVMFLDKFNFSLVEIDPSNVASYTAHYQMYKHAVMGSKNKKKTEFKRALIKAEQLLHMGNEYVEDDLVLLEEPTPAEKKQRMDEVMEFEKDDEQSLDDAWDDQGSTDDSNFGVNEVLAGDAKAAKMPQRKATSKSRKAKRPEAKDSDEDEVVILTPAKPRRRLPPKYAKASDRRTSRKDSRMSSQVAVVSRSPSPIDLTSPPECEKKRNRIKDKAGAKATGKPPRPKMKKANGESEKKNGRVKVLVLEDDDNSEGSVEEVDDEVADPTQEEEQSDLVPTPLSSIWTTGVSGEKSGVTTHLAYKQDFVWDNDVFTDELSVSEKAALEQKKAEEAAAQVGTGRERSLSKRQPRSVQQSNLRQNLMAGNLDPHTMVQCAAYRPKDYVEDPNSRSRGGPMLAPPFQVVVHPDAVFVADLHAHLATCEIIGFLGGKWDEASKTLYIQAAFPCRSLVIDGDDGSTDVEMDPGSEIELRGIIENAQLEVVGWYHSHPAFAPDPSIRDIENQTSYQKLFQRPSVSKEAGGDSKPLEPFVGLIVGTYDTRRSTPVSLFRYFHTRGEKVSGGARREIFMPYEFVPERRQFRSVLQDEEREKTKFVPVYDSVLKLFKLELTAVKQELPMDVKAAPAQRSWPSRARVSGPVRKRKQSSEVDAEKSAKKPRAKDKRSTRSSSVATGNESLTSKEKHEASLQNGSTDSSPDADVSVVKAQLEKQPVEPQVKEVIAVVVTSKIVDDKSKNSRIAKNLKQISESSTSPSEDEGKDQMSYIAKTIGTQDDTDATSMHKIPKNEGSISGTTGGLAVTANLDAASNASTPQSLPPSYSAVTNTGRKRNRKPQKTTKNSNRSASPSSDGISPGWPPSPTNNQPSQTFFNAFQASGPVFSNGNCHEEVTPPPSRPDEQKTDNNMVEDTQYIEFKETMVTGTTGKDDGSPQNMVGKTGLNSKATSYAVISEEARHFTSTVVEKVLEKVVAENAGFPPKSGQKIDNSDANEEAQGEDQESKAAASVNVGEPATRKHSKPQLFGSNQECEDIQTSLQKMAGYLDILKSHMLSTAESKPEAAATESMVVETKPELDEDELQAELGNLTALRTKYGPGVSGCAEQVITLVDYYRDFERRTDLNEIWKSRITKLEKIESSLSEYVQYLNIPAARRHDFVKVRTVHYQLLLIY
ncbi:Myb-like protein H [Phytophthora citrophthora]|uniref:Myb-like protein H n=1 Tax=Phytophthora citrophthora TaxID=4793 RepID=A0AAD9LG92_9STRA|nr:Myb-like protein H [Phytophthora citrophthora]